MNSSGALFGLLLFLQIMLVLGVMLGGIYLLACLRRIASALESLAETSHLRVQAPPAAPVMAPAPTGMNAPQSASMPSPPSTPPTPVSHESNL